MKAIALQFGKAMSAALFVLLLVAVGTKNALAQTQVATLQHGDDVSVFYGQNAFVEAHAAAETGDIITLSSGTFVPCDITKAITLRGAGCAIDTVASTNPTIFGGNITLNVADTANFLTIEGMLFTNTVYYSTLYNPKYIRCNFTEIGRYSSYHYMNNAQFVNCIIDEFNLDNAFGTTFINSVMWRPSWPHHTILAYNSILRHWDYSNLSAYNTILVNGDNSYSLLSACSCINCLGVGISFGQAYNSGCAIYDSYEEVFESFAGEFSLDEPFILKDEIASGFLGSDGTQVGIYGGFMPYNPRPTYMVLKRCNVANKSTIDGKLSVDIEVVTEEE